jgi:hypothetical protein
MHAKNIFIRKYKLEDFMDIYNLFAKNLRLSVRNNKIK